jgi:hydrogenase large subunit
MVKRIVIDPVTRIEGHLRIELEVKDGAVVDAYSSGTMVRGLEIILRGRDPRDAWAFAERTCGVCTTVHALASVRSVEDALDITVPPNADLIRNLMFCAHYMQDHVVHFYHLHALDWVDVLSALEADTRQTSELARSLSDWSKSSPRYFSDVQRRLKTFVESGQLGIFANGYWGHGAYKLSPEANLLATAHYLEALEWQKEVVKIHSLLGGKNPHPDYLVGGVACAINLDEANALNAEDLAYIATLLDQAWTFVTQVYLPDLMAVASFYKDWATIGVGLPNYMAYGDLPTDGFGNPSRYKFPGGILLDRNLDEVHPVDHGDADGIQEEVAHSWYEYTDGDGAAKHPWAGETKLNYTGPKPPYEHLDVEQKYSWLKTPRYKGHPMEVGPLARVLVAYASGHAEVKALVDDALSQLDVPVPALFSTLGRTLARGLETRLIAGWAREFLDQLQANIKSDDLRTFTKEKWDPETWPVEAKGVGRSEAPRGALAHWIVIKDKKIDNYQMVVPTTWNASPRDRRGQRSAYEAALLGTPVADPERPLEVLRTIHSFDPCLACAVHLYDEKGAHLHRFTTY